MKKLLSIILVLALTLALSGCTGDNVPIVDNSGMDEKDVLREIGQELHDFVVTNGFDDMIQACDNADTPDAIGGLGDTYCEEMITWYADNWEELYDLLHGFDDYEDYDTKRYNDLLNLLTEQIVTDALLLQRIEELNREVNSLNVMIEIITEVEHNDVENQCLLDDGIICYNNNFYYQIIDNDTINLIYGVYGEYRIDLRLRRQDDGDFYTTFIGYMTQSSMPYWEESFEIYDTTHYGDTAISLIKNVIDDEDWTLFIKDNAWEELKVMFEVNDNGPDEVAE